MPTPLVSPSQLSALRAALGSGPKPLMIATHNYPDPDALAACMCFQEITRSWGMESHIVHGGIVGRPENICMVELLEITRVTISAIEDFSAYRGALFVDVQPESRNHSIPAEIAPLAVIDHHQIAASIANRHGPAYADVRLDIGSSSTLALQYLDAAGLELDKRLATALLMGIKTDTDNLMRDASPTDVDAYVRLIAAADLGDLAKMMRPPLSESYFRLIHNAMENCFIQGRSLVAYCGYLESTDLLSVVSDMLVPISSADCTLACGYRNGMVYFSLRTKLDSLDATHILRAAVDPDGNGGGHGRSAGGMAPDNMDPLARMDLAVRNYLTVTGALDSPRRPLLS